MRNSLPSRKTEKHVTIVLFPDKKFLDCVYNYLMVKLKLFRTIWSNFKVAIEALACDGTNINVKPESGINYLI